MQIRGCWIRHSHLRKAVPEVPRGPGQCGAPIPGFGSTTPKRDKRSRLRPTMSEWQLRIRAAPFGSTQNYSSFVTKFGPETGPELTGRCVGREFKSIPAKRWLELGALSGVQFTTRAIIDR